MPVIKIRTGNLKEREFQLSTRLKKNTVNLSIRKTLFRLLGKLESPERLSVLVLYSGTGIITWELISQGVIDIESIELDDECVDFQEKIASELGCAQVHIENDEGMRYLYRQQKKYDLIIATPGHDVGVQVHLPKLVFNNNSLTPNGRFYLSHPNLVEFTNHQNYEIHLGYKYERVTVFRHEDKL